jgi:uncharacterized protein YndB with AHSA1/START domain
MSVKVDASGRRYVQVEVEVPGTPEEVWEAIATGPGISSWFVPTQITQAEDGTRTKISEFGPGMESVAPVTAWDPPHRWAAESRLAPDTPPMATEWIVEARSGGTCVVRVVHSLFASTDDWDSQLDSVESGWPGFFRILRLYLTHFRGQRCSAFQVMGMATEPASTAWAALTDALRLAGARAGQRVRAPEDAPALGGLVEHAGQDEHGHQLLLRLDEPAPGIAHLLAIPMGSQVCVLSQVYLYGDQAAAAAAGQQPLWQGWLGKRFPMAG